MTLLPITIIGSGSTNTTSVLHTLTYIHKCLQLSIISLEVVNQNRLPLYIDIWIIIFSRQDIV